MTTGILRNAGFLLAGRFVVKLCARRRLVWFGQQR